ncbi:MAG: 50S ribosomal protein L25 [Rubrobacteridae bacterium]|nr:50S ribosomal protein L25 [Rubrobacteridae bacterium]
MEITELKVERREVVGKESSKKLRRQGMVPAVFYSDGNATSITVNAREFSTLTHSGAGTHVIVKLKVAGDKKQPNAIIKEVQYNPVKNEYFHIDFQEIALNETIATQLPITIVGESPGVKMGGVLEHHLWEVEVEGLPEKMPDHIEADIGSLDIGDNLHVGDIVLPNGVVMLTDPGVAVLSIVSPQSEKVTTGAVEGVAPESAAGAAEAAIAAEE